MDAHQVLATLPDRVRDLPRLGARVSLLVQRGISMIPTPEELARLIPEASGIGIGNGMITFTIDGRLLFAHSGGGLLLLESRRTLERYRGALEKIRDRDWVENALDPQWSAKIAKEAIE